MTSEKATFFMRLINAHFNVTKTAYRVGKCQETCRPGSSGPPTEFGLSLAETIAKELLKE